MVDPLDGTSFDRLLLVSNLPPALQQTLSLHPHVVAERVPASRLLTPCRMDVAYKFVLARQIATVGASDYGIRQYLDHMRVVSASVAGDDPRGAVTDSLVAQFTDTICSIRRHGFDPNRAVILNRAGDIIDGSHRVAACLALGTPVVAVSTDSALRYDLSASRFRWSETRTEQAHEALLQYVKINADVRLVLLWPGAEALDEARVASELLEHHEVVDEGRIVVSRALGRALGMAARSTEPWLSGSSHDDAGARDGLVTCSGHSEGVLRYYVV